MKLQTFLSLIISTPENIQFNNTIDVISVHYHYTPTTFHNGSLINKAGENEGSCKIFAFAFDQHFTEQQTLHCFGEYYRKDVLLQPEADNHANIRQFINSGFSGIAFQSFPLTAKQP